MASFPKNRPYFNFLYRLQELEHYVCDGCRDPGNISENNHIERVMHCPGCRAPTQKTAGCNHMTCLCGQHWCWICGKGESSADDVHEHIYEVHNSHTTAMPNNDSDYDTDYE